MYGDQHGEFVLWILWLKGLRQVFAVNLCKIAFKTLRTLWMSGYKLRGRF